MNTTQHKGRQNDDRSPRREGERRRRKTATQTLGKLGVNPDLLDHSKYAYRWLNDEQNGRIVLKTQHDDWDLVSENGEKEDNTDLGGKVSVIVGAHKDGSPKRAYLARKLKTFYEEDRAEAQKALDRQLTELRRGNARDGSSQSDYVPHEGISMS